MKRLSSSALGVVAILVVASGLVACGEREIAETRTVDSTPRDLGTAQTAISAYVEEHASKSEYDEVVVTFAGTPLELRPPVTIDVEGGSGHGNAFDFLRFLVGPRETEVERVTWRGTTMSRRTATAAVERTRLPTTDVLPVIDLVRALSTTTAERRRKPGAPLGGSSGSSSRDFLVLVRALDASGAVLIEREYAGHAGTSGEATYLPLEAVLLAAEQRLAAVAHFAPVAAKKVRTSHFSDAFSRNVEAMLRDSHWWVMEYGLEALAHVGNPGVLGALRDLAGRAPSLLPRQRAKLDHLIDEPETYLEGPSRDLPDD